MPKKLWAYINNSGSCWFRYGCMALWRCISQCEIVIYTYAPSVAVKVVANRITACPSLFKYFESISYFFYIFIMEVVGVTLARG
jgi:hypothetical protein